MDKILTVTANPAIDRAYFFQTFTLGEVHRPIKTAFTAGGKGLNVSRVCGILGTDVVATGFVGGYTGDFIRAEVKKQGITDGFTPIAGETRQCINICDSTGFSSEILEKGPAISAAERDAFLQAFETQIADRDIVTVSGSLPQGLTPDFYLEIANMAKQHNKKVIFDTSGKTFAEIVKARPFMVKPNRDEFMQFTGWQEFDAKNALLLLKELGVEIPFITLGKDGAVAMVDGRIYKFSVPAIQVVSPVGSGDSTVAGIATGLSRGMPVCDAIRLGMAAGITNALFEGTGCITKELVAEFYEKVTVEGDF